MNVGHPIITRLPLLKQCPFCAGLSLTVTHAQTRSATDHDGHLDVSDHIEHAVMCLNCGAIGPSDLTVERAAEMWNMRRREFPAPYITKESAPEICPYCHGTNQDLDGNTGGSCTHCFGGYVK